MSYKRSVRFVEPWLEEDLKERPRIVRAGARVAREELERDGLDPDDRRVERCQEIGSDGTELGGCVKFTLPLSGHWRMVLVALVLRDGDSEAYLCLAVGQAHPRRGEGPSVYEIADRRLHNR